MKVNAHCLACLIRMQEEQLKHFDNEEKNAGI